MNLHLFAVPKNENAAYKIIKKKIIIFKKTKKPKIYNNTCPK